MYDSPSAFQYSNSHGGSHRFTLIGDGSWGRLAEWARRTETHVSSFFCALCFACLICYVGEVKQREIPRANDSGTERHSRRLKICFVFLEIIREWIAKWCLTGSLIVGELLLQLNIQPTVMKLFCSSILNIFGFPLNQDITLVRTLETLANLHPWNFLKKYEMSDTPMIFILILKIYFYFYTSSSEYHWHEWSGCQESALQWDSE